MKKAALQLKKNRKKILKLQNDIKKLKDKIMTYQDSSSYLEYKIESINPLSIEKKSKYFHLISKEAQKYNIKVLNFSNYTAKNILYINLKIESEFIDALNFINFMEKTLLNLKISTLKMMLQKEKILTDLNITILSATF